MKNAAVIVLYRPDPERVKESVRRCAQQLDKVLLVDNGENAALAEECRQIFVEERRISPEHTFGKDTDPPKTIVSLEYLPCGGNTGIAHALNVAVNYCDDNNIDWLLTLDDDSQIPENMISKYEKYTALPNVGIIACSINYNGVEQEIAKAPYEEVESVISSGSYLRVSLCKELGGFDEEMFIDRVDFEYCYRVVDKGYRILKLHDVVLNHRLGNLKLVSVFGKPMHVENHGASRKYYIAKNIVYCHRKRPSHESTAYCLRKLGLLILKTILFEDDKSKKLQSVAEGVKAGLNCPVTEKNELRKEKKEE